MKHRHIRRILSLLVLIAIAVAPSCIPPLTKRDAGDASFVRQVVPILYGRKVRGYEELKMMTDLIAITNRKTLVRSLMAQTEFIDHWSEVLVDDLRVQREGAKSQAICFAPPLLAGAPTKGLAQFVLNNGSSSQYPQTFNMTDLIRSALVLDNLYPVYKAYLFPMATKTSSFQQQERRNELGATFGNVYLNRELGCLLCHNSQSSFSGEQTGWDRTWPIPGYFEKALYGDSTGTTPEQAYAIFRTDVIGFSQTDEKPWGMENCGRFKTSVGNDPEGHVAQFAGTLTNKVTVRDLHWILQYGYSGLAANGLDRSLPAVLQSQCAFCQSSCNGVNVAADAPLHAANATQVKNLLVANCTDSFCHSMTGSAGGLSIPNNNQWYVNLVSVAASKPGEIRVIPSNATNSYLIKKLQGAPGINGSQMPLGQPALSGTDINLIKAWIDDIPATADCAQCPNLACNQLFPDEVKGYEAFAFLVASRIVENVWQEAMGHSLTIANYFPRESGQRGILWNLTEYQFIPSDWSLKELLVRILTTNYFNRVPPADSLASTAYEMEPVFDPWVVADPREPPVTDPGYSPANHPENHKNAMGEAVTRYSARGLLNATHRALGWPAPKRFADNLTYPTMELEKAIGQYVTDQEPGFQSVDFQGLLFWESIHGICDKPAGLGSDWIDDVMTDVANFPANAPGGPLSLEDLIVLLRDWLLGDGTIAMVAPDGLNQSEAQMLAAYFGQPLNTPANSIQNLEDKLRGLCGIFLETPDFMLAGIAPAGLGPKPRLRVCTDGPCSYQQVCQQLRPAVDKELPSGKTLSCGFDTVSIRTKLSPFDFEAAAATLCPPSICGYLPLPLSQVEACVGNPLDCRREPPDCDPRCDLVDCCGGPAPPVERRGYLLAWADGARVTRAEGISILHAGAQSYVPLEKGEVLRQGDLIAIIPGSPLTIDTGNGSLRTPDAGFPHDDPVGTRLIMITGEKALDTRRPSGKFAELPSERVQRAVTTGWHKFGSAGRPLTEEQRLGYVGPEQQQSTDEKPRR